MCAYIERDNTHAHIHTHTPRADEGYTSATDAANFFRLPLYLPQPRVSPTTTVSGMVSGGKRGAGACDAPGDHGTAVTVGFQSGGGGIWGTRGGGEERGGHTQEGGRREEGGRGEEGEYSETRQSEYSEGGGGEGGGEEGVDAETRNRDRTICLAEYRYMSKETCYMSKQT
jgi:hypothetical protein